MEITDCYGEQHEFTDDESELCRAVLKYRSINNRPNPPTVSEILAVVLSLGYRKVAEPSELPRFVRTNNQFTKRTDETLNQTDL